MSNVFDNSQTLTEDRAAEARRQTETSEARATDQRRQVETDLSPQDRADIAAYLERDAQAPNPAKMPAVERSRLEALLKDNPPGKGEPFDKERDAKETAKRLATNAPARVSPDVEHGIADELAACREHTPHIADLLEWAAKARAKFWPHL